MNSRPLSQSPAQIPTARPNVAQTKQKRDGTQNQTNATFEKKLKELEQQAKAGNLNKPKPDVLT